MSVKPTNTKDPNYFHKVVDCQWACPAHTNVPEYIRLIADGKFTESYLLNRKSNVFPGILGRVCDRPCEPACRRGRVDESPVAICRLKRVAADHKEDVLPYLPSIPKKSNGIKIALLGAGPASLTVANDLAPLGYEIHIFEKDKKLGGAMRFSVPGFRLPENVLDEEIDFIVGRGGVTVHSGYEVKKLSDFTNSKEWGAVFVGTGAPKGRDLNLKGRDLYQSNIHVGLNWLANIAFGHTTKIGKKVVVIGGGNTAMDCCRSALRLGAEKVWVVAPEAFDEMLASPWEKEDALAEGVEFINHCLPEEFMGDDSSKILKAMRFKKLKSLWDVNKKWAPVFDEQAKDVVIEVDDIILAVGQNTAYNFIDEASQVKFTDQNRPLIHAKSFQSQSNPKVFFGGDSAFGPKNIIWAVAQAHDAAISMHLFIQGKNVLNERPPEGVNLVSQKMGLHEWSYDQKYADLKREHVPHLSLADRMKNIKQEVELGFSLDQAKKEAERCLNCDVQTVFSENLCIECDACLDICPMQCLTITEGIDSEAELRKKLSVPAQNITQDIFVSLDLPQTARWMVKDEDLCIHCGLCAERCPTGAWDMQKSILTLSRISE